MLKELKIAKTVIEFYKTVRSFQNLYQNTGIFIHLVYLLKSQYWGREWGTEQKEIKLHAHKNTLSTLILAKNQQKPEVQKSKQSKLSKLLHQLQLFRKKWESLKRVQGKSLLNVSAAKKDFQNKTHKDQDGK